MNRLAIFICGSALTAGLASLVSSCDSKARLAADLQGEWSGNPEKVLDTGAASASMVRILEFNRGSADTEGSITITALITVDNTMQANDSVVTPLQITASGTASITGVYQAKDDDEITVSIDATSMSVNVDPEAVQLNYNVLTQSSAPIVEKLRPAAAILATQQIHQAAQNAFSNITKIDDIHIQNGIMKCEIKGRNLVFSKPDPDTFPHQQKES